MKRTSLFKALYIAIVILASGLLLSTAAAQKSFWEDEAFTVIFAQKPAEELLQVAGRDVHPPLYLILAGQWGGLFGFDEVGVRSLSIVFALLALLLTYKFTHDLMGERVALIALPLLALNPLFIQYAHQARYYSLALMLALLIAWSTLHFRETRHWPFLVIYILSGIAILYLLFGAAIVLVICFGWWLVRWWQERSQHRPTSLGLWLLAQVTIFALYLPGLGIFQSVTERFAETAQVANWVVELAKRAAYYGFVSSVGETLSPLNPLAWLGVILIGGLAIYGMIRNYKDRNAWLVMSLFLLIVLANLLATLNAAVSATWQNVTYRALYAYPFLMIWLAGSLARLKMPWQAILGGALAVVFLGGIFNYFSGRQFIRPVYTVPWREIFERIQEETQPGALVICGYGDSSCYYYAGIYGFGQNDLNNWANSSRQEYPEIWYIRTNLGSDEAYGDQPQKQAAFLAEMAVRYPVRYQVDFAPQDPSIRLLKAQLMNQDDYEFRINLLHFTRLP